MKSWPVSTYLDRIFVQVVVVIKEPVKMRKYGFNDPALVTHVGDHAQHVVIGGSDEGGSKNDGQISDLHFIGFTVFYDFDQMTDEVM